MLRCAPCRTLCNTKFSTFPRSHIHTQSLIRELDYRGLLANLTICREDFTKFTRDKRVVYCGIDPTAASLHVGNLLPLLTLLHFQLQGHKPIALLGGATGLIGDPSGREQERPIQAEDNVRGNVILIQDQVVKFFENAHSYLRKRIPAFDVSNCPLQVVNNLEWWSGMTLIEFLYSTGKLARVSSMLSKESVKNRMESSGISFAEFSYQLLQAHDFWHLFRAYDCSIQVGGSDQWGNILAGLDIIGRHISQQPNSEKALGITTPLLVSSSGRKFGKTSGNAIWIDSKKTSVFDFYQFFLRTPDSEVEKYLKIFTFLEPAKIEAILLSHNAQPELRSAQRELAREITELIHGEISVVQAQAVTRFLFETDVQDIRIQDVVEALRSDPRYHVIGESELVGVPVAKLAASSGLTSSRAEATRLIELRGLYLNNVLVATKDQILQEQNLIGNQLAILRAGKGKHVILALR